MFPTKKLLCELVALPSINPAFLPPGDPRAGEHRVAEFLAAVTAKAGLDIQFQDAGNGRCNLLAHLTPAGKIKHTIALAPHLDTVGVTDEKQFKPVEKNGRLYARGACDTKGCVAAMVSAICSLAASGRRPQETEIIFCGLVDEENAQTGSRALAASHSKIDLAIVGEPTELKLVTAHKGSQWLRFETHGKAAHGSRPDLGKNAVHEMARLIDWLQTDYAALLRKRKHPLLGHATISAGTITGGVQPNIVPDLCVATADRRTLPGENEKTVRRELESLLRKQKLSATVCESKDDACLPMETDTKLPLVQKILETLKQKAPLGVDYFCDASILSRGGIPSVVFGPGNIAQAHTVDEWISLRQLDRAAAILLKFFESLP